VVEYLEVGLRFDIMSIDYEQPVSDQRNQILSRFHENHVFTHLLFLDGDVFYPLPGWSVWSTITLTLSAHRCHPKELAGGARGFSAVAAAMERKGH
jgi:hypothetical protein